MNKFRYIAEDDAWHGIRIRFSIRVWSKVDDQVMDRAWERLSLIVNAVRDQVWEQY